MGLNAPLIVRYARWLEFFDINGEFNGMFEGNFGYSQFFSQDVVQVIKSPMKNTIFINIFSTIAALAITIPLGIYCAVHKGKKFRRHRRRGNHSGYSISIYIIALIFHLCLLRIAAHLARQRNKDARHGICKQLADT